MRGQHGRHDDPWLTRAGRRGALAGALLAAVLITGVLPPRTLPAGAQSPVRLDRHLRSLRDQHAIAVQTRSAEGMAAAAMVDVVVQSTRDVARELAATGGVVGTSLGRGMNRVHTARVPVAALDAVAGVPGVQYVGASLPLQPQLDVSAGASHTQASSIWSTVVDGAGQPVTGKGVIVAVVDSGIDWSHRDLVTVSNESRILAVWDQVAAGAPPPGYSYGRVWSREHLNAWLAAGIAPGETCVSAIPACAAVAGAGDAASTADDLSGIGARSPGHGTHVAAIAAANGRAATGATDGSAAAYTGLAPDADLLIVKSDLTTSRIIDAWQWIVAQAQAAGKPVVINNSFGGHLGAHDGTNSLEVAIDALSGPGVIFTVAAGNAGASKIHGSGTAAAGIPSTAKVSFAAVGAPTSAAIDLWYRSADSLTISVIGPNGSTVVSAAKGASATGTYAPATTTVTVNQNEPVPAGSQTTHASVIFSRAASLAGTWTLSLSADSLGAAGAAGSPAPGRWDGWIDPAVAASLEWLAAASAGTTGGLDFEVTLTEPATAQRAVVAGSYVSKDSWTPYGGGTFGYSPAVTVGAISSFSSRGRTRDGREKPDVAAPGQGIVAARSSSIGNVTYGDSRIIGPNQRHRVSEGTSMAAPHVTGTIALLLQVRPSLTPEEALTLLRENALRESASGFTGDTTWTTAFGAGKLRALAPVQTAQAMPMVATSTATAVLAATATTTITQTATNTATTTVTPASTGTASPTVTVTSTATPTGSPAATATVAGIEGSATPAATPTPTTAIVSTATPTPTIAVMSTATPTLAISATRTATPTATSTTTRTATPTATPASAVTATATSAATAISTPTATPAGVVANTATPTPTASPTPTPTATPTVTRTPAPTTTATVTRTVTPTLTATRTPTATRTATPTRTPTATPVNEVIVPLTLRRAPASPSGAYETDVTFSIFENGTIAGSRTPVATFATRTDNTGRFSVVVAGGLDGRYDLVVKPAGALSRERNSVNFSRGVARTLSGSSGFGAFQEGDVDGDDDVDAADLAALLAAFLRSSGDSDFDPKADFDRDGAVTILDFSLLARSFGLPAPIQEP